jgi:hypothetical protein
MEFNDEKVKLKDTCLEKLATCINDIRLFLENDGEILLKIYDDCYMEKDVSYYMNNEQLNTYLTAVANNREILANF